MGRYALMQLNKMDTFLITSSECTISCLLGNIIIGLLNPLI